MNLILVSLTLLVAVNSLVIPQAVRYDSLEPIEKRASSTSLGRAPLYTHENSIPQKYIVVFKNGVNANAIDSHVSKIKSLFNSNQQDSLLDFVFDWTSVFNGYVGTFLDHIVDEIRNDPRVAFIEQDVLVSVSETTDNNAPWGLARLSTRLSLNGSDSGPYIYDSLKGAEVSVYVIDTGIKTDLLEFEGRASWGVTIGNNNNTDDNGHGTHVAGTIGSKSFGVAKLAKLVAVKVFGATGSGYLSDVVGGVNWVVKQHQAGNSSASGSVINMSLETGKSTALNSAISAAFSAGIHVAVAAGNNADDACNYSPGSVDEILTVAASDSADQKASFSNTGSCVDIYAPGVNVLSTWTDSDTKSLSGTSMATPHVAGILAYFLSLQPLRNTGFSSSFPIHPANLKKAVLHYATKDAISDAGDNTANLVPYNGQGGNLTKFWLGSL